MSNVIHNIDSPRHPRRRRSTSLDSKAALPYRENLIKQHASSNNLMFNQDNSDFERINNQKTKKPNMDSCSLFVNWCKDFKSVKPPLMNLSDPNIFKSEFPRHNDLNHKENYPPLVFLVSNNMKIDNEYEAFYINGYDEKLKEYVAFSETENKDILSEYSRSLELIDNQLADEAKQTSEKSEDSDKQFGDKKSYQRRFSETAAIIMQNKNQTMQNFLPREYQGTLNTVRFTSEIEILYMSQDKKFDKNYKTFPRLGVLSNFEINIFTRNNLKLKDSYILRHLYLGQCNDTQIANIDSCLRIGGPFGNDMIIRFPNPQSRNEWNKSINDQIVTYQESIKNITPTITIFNDTNPPSSVPLVSKTITINGNTVGLELKKMAMGIFEIKDIDIKDLSIIFLIKNKENVLHDDVSLIVLQEHVNNIQENSCAKSCLDGDKLNAIVKIIYYLRYNRPLTDNFSKDLVKIKKMINPKIKEELKCKLNKYNINSKWVDNEIPNWLMNLLSELYNEGAKCEGIFRLSGMIVHSDDYINQICENDDVKIDASIYTKASILKKFISIIDGSLLTSITKEHFSALSNDITSVEEFLLQEEQQSKLLGFIQKIPPNNLNLFHHILVVLNHIIVNSQFNQMNHTSLATCFSQNLFKHLSDEAVKINTLFECILHLINRIVNTATYNSIVKSYEKRRLSVESTESHPKSDIWPNLDVGSNSPTTTPRTCSDSPDDSKSSILSSQPVVPLRRKKAAAKYKRIESDSHHIDDQSDKSSINTQKKHQSLYDTSAAEEYKNQFDEVDSRMTMSSKSGELKYQLKNCANLISKETKVLKTHNTFHSVVAPENNHTNFQRQIQVNRKHQKMNSHLENTNQTENKSKNDTNEVKSVSKLTRSTDRVNPKLRSRSQSKLGETVPTISKVSRQPSKSAYQYNVESFSSESNDSNRDVAERKRSSSACRVSKLKEEYEANFSPKPPPLPLKKSAYFSDSQNVSKLIKDIEENKISRSRNLVRNNRSRNINGPVRSSQNVQMISTHVKPKLPSPSYLSNKSLNERLYDSNDDDVTFI